MYLRAVVFVVVLLLTQLKFYVKMALLSQLDFVYIKTFVAKCEGSHCSF